MNRLIGPCLLSITLCCCGWIDQGTWWEDGPYEVISTDGNVALWYTAGDTRIQQISGNVLAIGSNKKYIVVKRKQDEGLAAADNEPRTNELMFYYIDRVIGESQGPFNFNEFGRIKLEIDLPDFSEEF